MFKILVTGSSGVVGSALLTELQQCGYQTVPCTSADVDLRDFESTITYVEKVQPDAVIHLAATVYGLMGHVGHQGSVYLDNVLMNTHVVEAARLAGVTKFVGMGSIAMYSDAVPRPMRESDIWLGQPHSSEIGYAHAKRAMLAQLDAYSGQYGLEFAYALSTNVYGPNDKFDEQKGHVIPSLVSKFYRAVSTGNAPTVWGTGRATRDFIYSADAARGLRLMLERGSGVYNLASGQSVTIRDAAAALATASGFDGDILWDSTKPDGQLGRSYDVTALCELGWAPQSTFADGLAETYSWYTQNYPNVRS